MKHTLTPIRSIQRDNGGAMVDLHAANGELIGSVVDTHAAFIVHAVNSHQGLLEVLSRWGRHDTHCPLWSEPNLPGDLRCTCGLSDAIALAERGDK